MIVPVFDAAQAKAMRPGEHLTFTEYKGLRLLISTRYRTWNFRYKPAGSKWEKQMVLGRWPAMTFGEAHDAWKEARDKVDAGHDVATERRARTKADKAMAAAAAAQVKQTCAFIVERYLVELVEANRKAKGSAEARRMLERAIVGVATVPARELTKEQARSVIIKVAATARRVAAMTRQELRACWAYAEGQGWVDTNPFAGKDLGGKFKAVTRERALSAAEAGALLRWMHEPGAYSRTVADALELVLRTGLRSGEVCGIHSDELAERGGVLWLDIPAGRMKAKKAHSVPLVGRARALVEARRTEEGGYLFPQRKDAGRPIEQKVLGVDVYAHAGRSKAAAYVTKRMCPVKDWVPHDLRRTARTLLGELGCPFEIGEAILAHTLPGVARVYNRASYEAQRVEWLDKLGQRLDQLAAASNVVAIGKRAA